MNCSRTFHLAVPTGAEDLWQRLATILPKLVKLYARITHTHSTNVVVGPELSSVDGPLTIPNGGRHYYSCSEHGVSATADLLEVVKDGHTYRSVGAAVISATVSTGMYVCQLYSGAVSPSTSEPIDKLHLECNDNAVDEVVGLIRSAVDVHDVTR
jgi:hypothetical protein